MNAANPGITANEKIEYNVKLSNDNGIIYEANYEKYYAPTLLFNHIPDTNGLTGWTQVGGWINTTSDAYSNTNSLGTGVYSNTVTKTLTTTNSYDFSNSTEVLIQFYSKWDIERNYDFVEVLGSPDGGSSWISLKGKYTKPNATSATTSHDNKSATYANFQANSSGQIYDGDRMDNWVMEEITIDNTYLTLLNSSNVKIRFNFRTDALNVSENYSTTSDGFFIDDFKIISIQIPCVTSVPTGLNSATITASGATMNWDNIPSATYDLRYRVVGSGTWIDILDITTTTNPLTGLSASTNYEVQVRSKCDVTNSAFTSSVNFSTLAVNYCVSNGNITWDTGVTLVSFNGINNADTNNKDNGGYEDFTGLSTNVTQNSSYNLTVNIDSDGGTAQTIVWIDWNKNGDFDDSGERIDLGSDSNLSDQPTASSPYSITIPATAAVGTTRMRVAVRYGTTDPTSCATGYDGEVEDYTINIIDSTLGIEDEILSTFNLYPNPVKDGELKLQMPKEITDFNITISNVLGQKVYENKVNSDYSNIHTVNTSSIKSGIYFVTVSTNLGKATKKMIIE